MATRPARYDLTMADQAKALRHLRKARSALGALRGQPCTVIMADGTLGTIARDLDHAINVLED